MFSVTTFRSKIWFKIRRNIIEALSTDHSGNMVAFSFAIGTIISSFPTPGLSAFIAFIAAILFKKLNKAAIVVSLMIWNPVTLIPLYWLGAEMGFLIFEQSETILFKYELLNQVYRFSKQFIIGSAVVAVPFAGVNYFLALFLIGRLQTIMLHKKRIVLLKANQKYEVIES